MQLVLLVVHVLIAIGLIGIVLIQRSDSDGFGLGSGSGSNLLSGRQTANLLTRTTAILATLFICNSLLLSYLAANRETTSLVDMVQEQAAPAAPLATGENEVPADASEALEAIKEAVPSASPEADIPAPAVPLAE